MTVAAAEKIPKRRAVAVNSTLSPIYISMRRPTSSNYAATRTVVDLKNFIRGALKQFAQNKGFAAGIWHEDRLAGVIGYDPIDWENRSTALGYWLGEEYQGKGLVTAACRALVEHAFGELGLNRVVISCATENEKSCAIPERLGFRREGIERQAEWLYDRFVDHVTYSALASEWPTRHS